MPFWKRDREPEVRVAGTATVLTVGSTVLQSQQQAMRCKVRLQVALESGTRYEVTTAWQVDHGQAAKVVEGATFTVDVVEGHLEQVHPRDGRMTWDRTRTPQEPKVRMLDETSG